MTEGIDPCTTSKSPCSGRSSYTSGDKLKSADQLVSEGGDEAPTSSVGREKEGGEEVPVKSGGLPPTTSLGSAMSKVCIKEKTERLTT